MSPARKRAMLVGVLGVLVVAGVGWALVEEEPPEPEPEVAEGTEADPSREETEDLMRKIGYVQ